MPGWRRTISRVASTPDEVPRCRSMRTTSGSWASAAATASSTGVALHVADGLGGDGVDGRPDLGRHRAEPVDGDVDLEAGGLLALGEVDEGGGQAQLLERRGEEPAGQAPHLLDASVELDGEPVEQRGGGGRVALDRVAGRLEAQPDAGERWAQPVVELAPQRATLLVAGLGEAG